MWDDTGQEEHTRSPGAAVWLVNRKGRKYASQTGLNIVPHIFTISV
jgi:hypothetical protein